MTDDRRVPRYPDKPPCNKCGDKGYITVKMKGGDTSTTLCDVCHPPKPSQK